MKKNLLTLSTVLSLILFAGCGSTNTQTKAPENININDVVNTAPIATFDKFSINRNVAYDGQLTATDADGDTLKYIIVTQPQHGSVAIDDNGCFTYIPNTGYQGSDSFSYKASDDVSSCSVKTVTVDVCEPTIELPTAPTNLTVKALSTTKLELTWSDNSNNEEGFVIYRDGKLVASACENVTKKVICCGLEAGKTYTFEVRAKNEAGVSTPISALGTTNDVTTPPTELKAKAIDKTSLRLEWKDNANNESAYEIYKDGIKIKTISTGCHCKVVNNLKSCERYNFTVKAVNKIGSSSSNTISVDTLCEVVKPANHAPIPTFISLTTDEDITYNGTLTATDPESDVLTFAKVADTSHGTVTVDANGNFTYIPTADYNGDDSFSYSVSDANNAPVVQTVAITITDVAEPDTTPPVITLTGDATMTLTVGDSYAELGATAHDDRDGAVDVVISGSIDTTTAGSYTITYRAEDSAGNSSEVSREVVVEASTLPTITIGADTTVEDIVAAEFDSDDSIDITYTNIRTGATFSISGHADFSISDSGVISYEGDVSAPETVNLTVTVQNVGEVAVSKTFTVSILNNA